MVMGTSASAVPFSYRFESTVAAGTVGLPASPGDPVSITVTLDNGGASLVTQVWTAADLQTVTFDINNGAATASFFSPFDVGLVFADGNFVTDAAGNLTSVMDNWGDVGVGTDFVASFPFDSGLSWSINDLNLVLFDSGFSVVLLLADVDGPTDPANWSLVTATALPLPSTLLLLLVGLGGVALLRRAKPSTAGGVAEARGA